MMRQTGLRFLTRPEIGVASTAFTTQLVALFILAVTLGRLRGYVDDARSSRAHDAMRWPAGALEDVLEAEPQIERWENSRNTRMRCFSGAGCITRSRSKAR